MLDAASGAPVLEIPAACAPCAVSPDGQLLLAASCRDTHQAGLFRAATGEQLAGQAERFVDSIRSCGFSPDGAFAVTGNARNLGLWDIHLGREMPASGRGAVCVLDGWAHDRVCRSG